MVVEIKKSIVEKLRRLDVNQLREIHALVGKLSEDQTEKEVKDERKHIV